MRVFYFKNIMSDLLDKYRKIANSKGVYENKGYRLYESNTQIYIHDFYISYKALHFNSFQNEEGIFLCCNADFRQFERFGSLRILNTVWTDSQQINYKDVWSKLVDNELFLCNDIYDERKRVNSKLLELKECISNHDEVITDHLNYKILDNE